jgi:hypothetical protein
MVLLLLLMGLVWLRLDGPMSIPNLQGQSSK